MTFFLEMFFFFFCFFPLEDEDTYIKKNDVWEEGTREKREKRERNERKRDRGTSERERERDLCFLSRRLPSALGPTNKTPLPDTT